MDRILLVEDSKFFGKIIIKKIKAELGFDVTWVETYTDTVQLLEEWTSDFFIALLDLNLPDAPSGKIVDLVSSKHIPSIVFTGEVNDNIRHQVWSKKIIDYVLKRGSEDIKYLISMINRIYQNQSIHVLVVDDSKTVRNHICNILKVHQYKLLEAGNGEEALAVVKQHPGIKLVISDFNMPKMDGIELIKNIRASYDRDEMAIIGISAKNDHVLAAQFIKNGANDFICKPFFPEEFYCRVTRNIEIIEHVDRRKKAEKDLNIAKEQAVLASKMKSEFLASMSHEIRTPMNAIVGLSHLALETELNTKQQDYLNKIQSSAHSLLGIINDILDFSKIESGQMDIESVDFVLDDILDAVTDMVVMKAEEKGLEIIIETEPDVPRHLIGDPLRLRQVLLNLVDNAVKFTEAGEIIIRIDCPHNQHPEKTENGVLQFSVQDTGIGFSPSAIDRVFRSFSQGDGSITRKYGGTGLGLSICKRLAEMMGGDISLSSTPGLGSTFAFTARFGVNPKQENKPLELPLQCQGGRALIIDDNASVNSMLKNTLFSFGFAFVDFDLPSLEIYKTKNRNQSYDLILLDWHLPGKNGLYVAKQIKQQTALAEVPMVLMVSPNRSEEVMTDVGKDSIDAYLIKPFNRTSLYDAIMEVYKKQIPEDFPDTLPEKKSVSSISHLKGSKILLVEDNAINQQVAAELLENEGLLVTLVPNGKEAIHALNNSNIGFDAVLMDLQMPEMDGYEATRRIRQDQRYKDLPIIAMTAHAMIKEREKCFSVGMNDHTIKPIDIDILFSTLSRWIKPKSTKNKPVNTSETVTQAMGEFPGIDNKMGLKKIGGNKTLYLKLLSQFKNEFSNAGNQLRSLLKAGDYKGAETFIHNIKGVAGNIGATDLFDVIRQFESNAESLDKNTYLQFIEKFETSLGCVLASIEQLHAGGITTKPLSSSMDPTMDEDVTPLLIELNIHLKANDLIDDELLTAFKNQMHNTACRKDAEQLEDHVTQFNYTEAISILDHIWKTLDVPETIESAV